MSTPCELYVAALRRTDIGYDVFLHDGKALLRLYNVQKTIVEKIFHKKISYYLHASPLSKETERVLMPFEKKLLISSQTLISK